MSERNNKLIELAIRKELARIHLSPSHDFWHLDRVLEYAKVLESLYGGDIEIIIAAVLLHDLGRSDPARRGTESSELSAKEAEFVLSKSGFPPAKLESVLMAIREHDQPMLSPSTLEGRILKDADFLAGFGAWGVVRIAIWAGETGEGVTQLLEGLENKMARRFQGLEFPESRKLAIREMQFARLFLSLLHKQIGTFSINQRSAYIILEGISGSGKDTQAKRLEHNIIDYGKAVCLLSEPTSLYKEARKLWGDEQHDYSIQTFLLMADRYKQIKEKIQPALESGQIVISVRSYLSNIVYQSDKTNEAELTDFIHKFVPIPDIVFILDLPVEEAHRRLQVRSKTEKRSLGEFESVEELERIRKGYLKLIEQRGGEGFIVINASQSEQQVESDIWQNITKLGILDRKLSRLSTS